MTRPLIFLLSCLGALLPAVATSQERVDLEVINQIRAEAIERSEVMEHLFYLSDVIGPRLTNSPAYDAATKWAIERLKSYGVDRVGVEPWGRFGTGWSFTRATVQMREPAEATLIGVPLAWTEGTPGAVTGEVVLAPFDDIGTEDRARLESQLAAYTARYRGKLKDRIVLLRGTRRFNPQLSAAALRYDDRELAAMAAAPDEVPVRLAYPIRPEMFRDAPLSPIANHFEQQRYLRARVFSFLRDEGVLAALTTDDRGDGAGIFVENGGVWDRSVPIAGAALVLLPEHYNRLVRLAQRGITTRLEVNVEARFHDDSLEGHNVIGEIEGGTKKDEVVMIGAHLDTWHGATGATDNGTGVAITIEAMRILKTLGLKMDRTVRIALWGGEEQVAYGSRGYVKQHFADPATMIPKPAHAKLAAYFNLDRGTGKIRGVYLQGNDMVRPIFRDWLEPFRDFGATTLTIRNTSGSDHQSFDEVGLPGFAFIQDPEDYFTRTHHSHLDSYDHVQPANIMQAAAIVAAFAYQAATRDDLLPREPMPKPAPAPSTGRW